MSMHPAFFDYHQRPRARRLVDQHFGLAITPHDCLTSFPVPQVVNRDYNRSWRNLRMSAQDVGSTIKVEKDKFQINLDVQHFSPEEISVKTADGFLIVEAKHDEKQDEHGYISRSFIRRYKLPDGIEPELVSSKLSSDGVLSITAPLKAPPKTANERVVPIIQTGPVKKQVEAEKPEMQETKEEK